MPSWSIHLAISKKVNESLKLDKDIFYLGNLIADIDYGNKLSRRQTHFNFDNPCKKCPKEGLPNIDLFLNEYKSKLSDTLILGYYAHLLTDYYYNNYVYSNCYILNDNNDIIGIKLKNNKIKKFKEINTNKRKKYKQYDLILYGKYLFNNNYVELPKYNLIINNSLKLLQDNFLKEEDVKRRLDYLHNEFYKFNKLSLKEKICGYKLFSKKELDKIYNECIQFILEEIEKIN